MSDAPPTRPSLLLRLRDLTDDEAWSEFVRLYTPLVFSHCTRVGLQEADAADIAQEVMRTAARSMNEFDYDPIRGKFHGWLLQTTRHRLYKFFDGRKRAPLPASNTEIVSLLDQEASAEESARWESDYRQIVFNWAAAKSRHEFQPDTWEAFWQTSMDADSVKDVARRLGISVGAVYIARSRVIARLRELTESVTDDPAMLSEH